MVCVKFQVHSECVLFQDFYISSSYAQYPLQSLVRVCWGKALGGSAGILTSPEGGWSPQSSSFSVDQSQSSHSKDQISSSLLLSLVLQSKNDYSAFASMSHLQCFCRGSHYSHVSFIHTSARQATRVCCWQTLKTHISMKPFSLSLSCNGKCVLQLLSDCQHDRCSTSRNTVLATSSAD